MAMDFPNSPTVNQTFTVGDKTWKWTGTVWEIVVNRPAMRSVADTPPASPMVGDEWFNSLTGRTYTWFDSYWVEVNSNSVVGASGLNGVASASAPLAYDSGSNNISVQSSPTFSGTLTAPTIATSAGRLTVKGSSSDTSGVLELQSYDGVKNYIYKENGSGLVIANSNGARVSTYNASGHITNQYQPVWNSDISSGTNIYSTFTPSFNVGFTQTNSSTITVQTAGAYYVKAQQLLQTAGGGYWQLQKNNVTFKHGYISTSVFYDASVGALIYMNVGDTFRIYTNISLSNSWNGAHSSLDIMKVA